MLDGVSDLAEGPDGAGDVAPDSLYERVGGRRFFVELVGRFYAGVAVDELLRPLYPEDLGPPAERLALFLIQLAGGPREYEALRGQPRLRLRHLEFPIGAAERDAWLARMGAALDASGLGGAEEEELRAYFAKMASFLVNRGLAIGGTR